MQYLGWSLSALFVFSAVALAQEPNWNQFRGPNSTNHSFSKGISTSWTDGPPPLLWKINTVGTGFSCVSFFGDLMFTMGDIGSQCHVFALDRRTGEEKWKSPIGKGGDGGGGRIGPFGTPACDGETVYAVSQFGDFVALDMKDGKERWRKSIPDDLGGRKMSQWGYAMSPLLDGDRIVVPVGGDAGTLAAFDKTGKLLWRTAEINDPAAYTSAAPIEIGGVKQYMILTGKTLAGVSPEDGKVIWRVAFPGDTAVCSNPALNGDVIVASCTYRVGTYFYHVTREGNTFKAEMFHSDQPLQNHHGGIVAVGDHFYFTTNNNLTCVEAKTGKIIWASRAVGKGSLTCVDGKLIHRSEGGEGQITFIEPSPEGYKEISKFDQPDRSELNSWAYPVVVDKKLYLRDQGVVLCFALD